MTLWNDLPNGFRAEPSMDASGNAYTGRLHLPNVQWTGKGEVAFATTTLTIQQIADASEGRMLWTDQSVQRGIDPAAPSGTPRELPLADGYPDSRYIFDEKNADDITEKLLRSQRMFLSPLVWNLRPGNFEAFWDDSSSSVFVYDGKIYLPDSHHRHQAILKAMRAYRDAPHTYPDFSPSQEVKVELYFLTRVDEGNYFFDKNQRPKSTALSKAFDLTTEDDLSVLAKRVLDLNPAFERGVNRATDRLSKKAKQFVTLSTVREMMRIFAGQSEVEETELDGLAEIASEFLTMLMQVRPELRDDTVHAVRDRTLASSAVMFAGYAYLMRDFAGDLAKLGSSRARSSWQEALSLLAPSRSYKRGAWTGDVLSKENPLWMDVSVTNVELLSGKVRITNSGGSRARAGRALREVIGQ